VANGILLPQLGFSRGFDSYRMVRAPFVPGPWDPRFLLGSVVRNALRRASGEDGFSARAALVNAKARPILDSAVRTHNPFFLWLNYMDAHTPYTPPAEWRTRYPGRMTSFDWNSLAGLVEDVTVRHSRPLSRGEADHLTSQYDGALAYLDDQVHELLETLRSMGLYDNSLIIITADHGEAFGESMIVCHGVSVYQSQVWVPLVVKYPGATTRATVSAPSSDVDILPTVLDVIGAAPAAHAEGRSLRTIDALPVRWITSESYRTRGSGFTSRDSGPDEMALFAGPWKLIVGAGGGMELYDLRSDPREHENLAGQRPIASDWLKQVRAAMDEARTGLRPAAMPLDAETLSRLRALGYIQ
jgi:arylsulfatase A-like enzyme